MFSSWSGFLKQAWADTFNDVSLLFNSGSLIFLLYRNNQFMSIFVIVLLIPCVFGMFIRWNKHHNTIWSCPASISAELILHGNIFICYSLINYIEEIKLPVQNVLLNHYCQGHEKQQLILTFRRGVLRKPVKANETSTVLQSTV